MRPRLLVALLVLAVAVVGSVSGLELTNGRMRLVLFESTGRFSAYYKSNAGHWTPLFYSQDPRTSVLEVKAGNNFYRMGDSSRFRQVVTKTSTGGKITWTSPQLGVTESFEFTTSTGATQPDGVRITVEATNLSASPVQIGIRYLIDTSLGEQSRIEFMTPSEDSMTNETQFSGSQVPTYWISPKDAQKNIALEDLMRGDGVTTPDRVIFANWKRLNDSQWDFTSDPTRNFNLLPYSINDSAVALYYNQQEIQPRATRSVTILLGQYSSAGWGTQSAPTPSTASSATANGTPQSSQAPSTTGSSSTSVSAATVQADLTTINVVLQQLQSMLASPGGVSQSDIDTLRQVLDKLKARKAQDEGQQ